MVDAVGSFKMFSEFVSLGGRFKQILVLDYMPIECADFMSLDFSLAGLSPSFHASSLSVYLPGTASIVLGKPSQSSRPILCIDFNLC